MKKLCKNRTGFTLIEILIVVAIAIILASVLLISTAGYLSKANTTRDNIISHNSNVLAASRDIENQS